MKLRIAKKIVSAFEVGREGQYTGWQQLQAINRVARTKSAKRADRLWNEIVGLMRKEPNGELPELTPDEAKCLDDIPDDAVDHWFKGEIWDGSQWGK